MVSLFFSNSLPPLVCSDFFGVYCLYLIHLRKLAQYHVDSLVVLVLLLIQAPMINYSIIFFSTSFRISSYYSVIIHDR